MSVQQSMEARTVRISYTRVYVDRLSFSKNEHTPNELVRGDKALRGRRGAV
jgi:hypothetical protein